MHPILEFAVMGFVVEIPAYTFFAAAGAAAGAVSALILLRSKGLSLLSAAGLLLMMAASFLIGARLWNFAVNPAAYGGAMRLWTPVFSGFSLYGGILGALGAFGVWARIRRVSPWPLLDTFVLPSGLAFILARIGCFLNGCCGGKATDSFWGVAFPMRGGEEKYSGLLSLMGKTSISVHPTQLYEMGLAIIGLVPAMWLYFRKKPPEGMVFLVYGMWFTAMRWAVLPLRNLPYSGIVLQLYLPALYGGLLFAGSLLLARKLRQSGADRKGIREEDNHEVCEGCPD